MSIVSSPTTPSSSGCALMSRLVFGEQMPGNIRPAAPDSILLFSDLVNFAMHVVPNSRHSRIFR